MGDVSTHAAIARENLKRLAVIDGRRAEFFEVGNYITDVSQFRDPFAHLSGKKRIWDEAQKKGLGAIRLFHLLDLVVRVDDYLDRVMGVPGQRDPDADPAAHRPDDGDLARWFKELIFVASCRFVRKRAADDLLVAAAVAPIDAFVAAFHEVYQVQFTQYFPHEHLDFPPDPRAPYAVEGDRGPSQLRTPTGDLRRILGYLEQHLDYVSNLLSHVERDWARAARTPGDEAKRRRLLAEFGHASHAVEDFYFHSNFPDLAFRQLHGNDPAPHGTPTPDDPPLPSDNNLQRKYHRRRRAPLAEASKPEAPNPDTSTPSNHVYTGSFGSTDIFFTLMDAAGGLERTLRKVTAPPPAGQPDLGVDQYLRTLTDALLGPEAGREPALKTHHARIKAGEYVVAARTDKGAGRITALELAAFERVCGIEQQLLEDFGLDVDIGPVEFSVFKLGVAGLLQQLLDTARKEVADSTKASLEIDGDATHAVADDRTFNGASGETIGTHTLMCKDSTRKEPLREQTVRLAEFVANYVGHTMTAQVPGSPTAVPGGVDWKELLQHFVGHPEQAARDPNGNRPWWDPPLSSIDPPPPALHTVVPIPAAELDRRADEGTRKHPGNGRRSAVTELEAAYHSLSAEAERRFRDAVDRSIAADSAITAGIIGGIVGAVTAPLTAPPATPAEDYVLLTAVGLVAGGTVAAATAGLTTGALEAVAGRTGGYIATWPAMAGGVTLAWLAGKTFGGAFV